MTGSGSGPREVVKVGGSLLDWPELGPRLRDWLEGRRAVLVAGGGAMADAVRSLDRTHGLGDDPAHDLALRAMDLNARALANIVPGLALIERLDEIGPCLASGDTPLLQVRAWLASEDASHPNAPPHRWEVTSDSISAFLARRLGVPLVLLKSVALPSSTSLALAARLGLVDPFLPTAASGIPALSWCDFRSNNDQMFIL